MEVRFSEENKIGTIVLIRPEKLQAINEDGLIALHEILKKVSKRKSLKALIICSADARAFSSGLDIFELKDSDKSYAQKISKRLHEIGQIIQKLKFPSVAAIDGFALGAGLEIALSCKYRIANINSILGLPQVRLGFLPGGGATQLLPKIVGAKEAQKMIIKGTELTAKHAFSIGLIDRLVLGPAKDGAIIFLNEILTLPKKKQTIFSSTCRDKPLGVHI